MPSSDARWMKLKDATKYGSIGKTRLIELTVAGVIKGVQDPDSKRGDWIFDRKSIDAYREAQMSKMDAHEKGLAIMRNIN
jgi:hypothetical protein